MDDTGPRLDVLLIEDDARIASLLTRYLQRHGIVVTHSGDGESGIRVASEREFDVVVLDLMLPRVDGLGVCRALRASSRVPIIMVTALGDEADRVAGLELGADDYMVKPISARELLARMRALLRRTEGSLAASTTLSVGDLVLYPNELRVTLAGELIDLTGYEFALLTAFAERPGRTLSREQLLDLVKGTSADEAFDRSIDVQISRLRKKLGDEARAPRRIKTVRGVGYMLVSNETVESS